MQPFFLPFNLQPKFAFISSSTFDRVARLFAIAMRKIIEKGAGVSHDPLME
jgi:hypothetical protein